MSNKRGVYAVLTVAVLAAGYMLLVQPWPDNTRPINSQPERAVLDSASEPLGEPEEPTAGALSTPAPGNAELDADAELEQRRWKVSRGFLTDETRYLRRQSDAQLNVLVEQGSTQALRILAGRQLTKDPQKMIAMLEEAIVQGDVPALLTVASTWSNPNVHRSADAFQLSPEPQVSTLALILTAQLRGDNVLAPGQLSQAFDDYQFDDRQIQDACGAARALYRTLENKRAEAGLPPFDNSPSPHGMQYPAGDHIAGTCSKGR